MKARGGTARQQQTDGKEGGDPAAMAEPPASYEDLWAVLRSELGGIARTLQQRLVARRRAGRRGEAARLYVEWTVVNGLLQLMAIKERELQLATGSGDAELARVSEQPPGRGAVEGGAPEVRVIDPDDVRHGD